MNNQPLIKVKKILIVVILLLFFSLPCYAEEVEIKDTFEKEQPEYNSLFSLDLSYSLTSILSQGWGVGLIYERNLFDFLSLKGNFGHMTLTTGVDDVFCTSVHISLFAYYYPFGSGLDRLYIGVGNGCDFMNYFGGGKLPQTEQDTLIHVTPQIGWKVNLLEFLMIDVSLGYKIIIYETQNYEEIKDYINSGFNLKIGLKLHFNKIFDHLKREKQNEKNV